MCARRFIQLVIASLVMALAVAPAAAAPPDKSITRTTNLFLGAFSPEAGVSVFVSRNPDGGYQVCVGTPEGFGCTAVADDAVTVDAEDLTSATLGPITIRLQRCDQFGCEPGNDVTIALTFTGTGELTKFQSRFKSMNGCKMMGSTKGIQRQGEATITIRGETYDADGFLTTSRDTFKVQCRH